MRIANGNNKDSQTGQSDSDHGRNDETVKDIVELEVKGALNWVVFGEVFHKSMHLPEEKTMDNGHGNQKPNEKVETKTHLQVGVDEVVADVALVFVFGHEQPP